jgi:hypothetical protein
MLQCVNWYIVACFFRVKQSKTSIWCACPWQWRQYASLKRWSIFANSHGIISQKSRIFISHVLKTSSLTLDNSHSFSVVPFVQYNSWCLFQDLWTESEKRVFLCIYGRTMQHTTQNFAFVYFSGGNFLMFQMPVVELKKVYSSASLITTILDKCLTNFILHKEELRLWMAM